MSNGCVIQDCPLRPTFLSIRTMQVNWSGRCSFQRRFQFPRIIAPSCSPSTLFLLSTHLQFLLSTSHSYWISTILPCSLHSSPFLLFTSSPFLLSKLLTLSALYTPPPFCSLHSSPFCVLHSLTFLISMYTPPLAALYAPHPFCSPCPLLPFLLSKLLTLSALYTHPPFCFLNSSPFQLSTLIPLSAF